jgi:hypothetical protein
MGRSVISSDVSDRSEVVGGKAKVWIVKSRRETMPTTAWFARNYCTAYAAAKSPWLFPVLGKWGSRYRSIQWDAWRRLSSAKSNGFVTSKKPTLWAIMVVWSSSQSRLGHVAIVKDIDYDRKMIQVSDMNYVGLGIVSVRWIQMNDAMTQATAWSASILWFIPVQSLPDQVQKEYNAARKG